MSFGIVTDSSADMHPSIAKEVIAVNNGIIIDGVERIEGEDITREELIDILNKGAFATTTQASPSRFKAAYEKATKEYDKVLSIHVGSKLSGVLNNANSTSKLFGDRITIFDSQSVSIGTTYLIKLAISLRERGYSLQETVNILQQARGKAIIRVITRDTDYLARSGRVTGTKFTLVKLLRLKPIIAVEDGLVIQKGVGIGIPRTIKKITRELTQEYPPESKPFIILGNVQANEYFDGFKKQILRRYNPSEYLETGLAGVIIAHLGPYALGGMFAPSLESYLDENQ